MFRAMSSRKVHRGYEQFISEPTADDVDLDAKMIRSTTLPANFYGELPVKFVMEPKKPAKLNFVEKQLKKASKVHPLFSLFERRNQRRRRQLNPSSQGFTNQSTMIQNFEFDPIIYIEVLLKSNWSSLSRFEGMHYTDDASVLSSNNRIIQMMHLFFVYVLIIIKIGNQLELHRYFYSVGAGVIEEVRLQCDKGFGFVTSNNHAEGALAIQMGNTQ
ncbi:hypothetical protein CTI12_AA207760 [Artemisia annua]|uniref:RRM domain-containing protein n=1 Tax=Artemisia annua TaxID=35608 RepID=A0A2U1P0K4_ARTAN|nr:hypothetical protein CTI12_AA207760 [Artemisia annua]